jgi:hypothetical protein
MITVKRSSCPEHVPVPEGSQTFDIFGGDNIEGWHKKNKVWVD